jgi:hypothetical protein
MGWPRPYEYDPTSAERVIGQDLGEEVRGLTVIVIRHSASRHDLKRLRLGRWWRERRRIDIN